VDKVAQKEAQKEAQRFVLTKYVQSDDCGERTWVDVSPITKFPNLH
jgi:hypothetical protein